MPLSYREKVRITDERTSSDKPAPAPISGNIGTFVGISNCTALQAIQNNLDAYYQLTKDIDCFETRDWNNGAGFQPIGVDDNSAFTGTLNGQHYQISDLYIYRPQANKVGLFGASSGNVVNIGLQQAKVVGNDFVGGLVGLNLNGVVSGSFSTGAIYGNGNAVGGLVGQNDNIIIRSYTQGTVAGANYVGGLVGSSYKTIANAYSTAAVKGNNGNVVGGLIGSNWAFITNAYSTGQVASAGGGLVGYAGPKATTVISYWNVQTSGKGASQGGMGKTTAQMQDWSTYQDWNFYTVWDISKTTHYPIFRTAPVSFSFKPIASPQIANVPFPVALIADSNLFNSQLAFYAERGQVSPLFGTMEHDAWNGMVTLYSVGKDNALTARWALDGFTGTVSSNNFSVLDAHHAIPNNATVVGRIVDGNNVPIANATVQAFSEDPAIQVTPNQTVTTDKDGFYRFVALSEEEYVIQTQKLGYQTMSVSVQTAENRPVTANQQLFSSCAKSKSGDALTKTPVLLLPGIMGSTIGNPGIFYPYPELPKKVPAWNSEKLNLLDPLNKWGKLKEKLHKYDYEMGCNVFELPYDWSLSVVQIRDQFLIPAIERVRKITGQGEVDIIAHSMGGLVVRSYIQSHQYPGGIRRFAMIATPNKGADNVYYLWEGGDPIAADENGGSSAWFLPGSYFYTHTFNNLFEKRSGNTKGACIFLAGKPTKCYETDIYPFVHAQVRSAGDLMPTYNSALVDKNDAPVTIIEEGNTLVNALNSGHCNNPLGCINLGTWEPYDFKPPGAVYSSDNSLVQTMLFVGNQESTIESIVVRKKTPDDDFYPDGVPIPNIDPDLTSFGDGTVWVDSAIFNDYLPPPGLEYDYNETASHYGAVGAYAQAVVNFLVAALPSPLLEEPEPTGNVTLFNLRINGRVDALLRGMSSITEEQLSIEMSSYSIVSPNNGYYCVDLSSPYKESYELSLTFFDEASQTVMLTENIGFFDQTLRNFSLIINNASTTNPLELSRAFGTPIDLEMYNATNGKMLLSWKDSIGNRYQDVNLYQIFWRLNYEPYYQYYDQSFNTYFETNLTWPEAAEHTFIVRSILQDSSSTFFSTETWTNGIFSSDVDFANSKTTTFAASGAQDQKVRFYPDQNEATGKHLLSYELNQNMPIDPMTSSASRLQPPYSSLLMTLVWLGRSGQHVWSNFNMRFNTLQLRTMEWLSQCYQYYSLVSLKRWYAGTDSLKNVALNQVDKGTVYSFQVSEENAYTSEGTLFSGCQVEFNNANEKPVIVRFETDASDKNQWHLPLCEIAKHQDTEQPFIYQDATIEHPCHIDNELLFVDKPENQVVAESQSCSSVPDLSQSWSSAIEQTALYSIYATLAMLCARKALHKIADQCSNKNAALSLRWFGDNVLPYVPLLVGLYSGGLSSRAALLAGVATSFALTRMGASKCVKQLGVTGVSTLTESVARYGIFGATTGYVMKQAAKQFCTTNIGLAGARHVEEVVENILVTL